MQELELNLQNINITGHCRFPYPATQQCYVLGSTASSVHHAAAALLCLIQCQLAGAQIAYSVLTCHKLVWLSPHHQRTPSGSPHWSRAGQYKLQMVLASLKRCNNQTRTRVLSH